MPLIVPEYDLFAKIGFRDEREESKRARKKEGVTFAATKKFRKSFKTRWACPPARSHVAHTCWPLFGWGFLPGHVQDALTLRIWYKQRWGARTLVYAWWRAQEAALTQCPGCGFIAHTLSEIVKTLWQEPRSLWHVERPLLCSSFVCTAFLRLWETSFFKFCHGWEMKQLERKLSVLNSCICPRPKVGCLQGWHRCQ